MNSEIKHRIVLAFKILFLGTCPILESYKHLAERQEPLGADFQEAIFDNIEELYEPTNSNKEVGG